MLNLNSDFKNKETILIPAATPQQKPCYTKLIFGNSLKLFSLQIQLPLTSYRRRWDVFRETREVAIFEG